MDSGGNSGSLQSSSGGDEEYDSRAADSFFITSHIGGGGGGGGGGLSIPPQLFDPFSSYMSNPSLLNPNTAWPGPVSLRSDPNPNPNSGTSQDFNTTLLPSPGSLVFQPPATGGAENGAVPAGQNSNQGPPPRNPRKRSRASRRAPTTVLTTDTTNFRAMVQEFTGIPAPPFNSSAFPRTRLDLFGGRSVSLDPPYFRRPFAQKVQSRPPFPAALSQTPNLFNFPNPLLLQSTPKFFSPNPPSTKPNHADQIDGLDEFGLSSGDRITGLPSLISSDQIEAQKNTNPTSNAADEAGSHYHQAHIRPAAINGGGYSFAAAGKTNLAANEKGSENVGGRSEGMVESWICSSSE